MVTKVDQIMLERCHDQGHAWENCCSACLEVYQRCKWCGEVRSKLPTLLQKLTEKEILDLETKGRTT